MNGETVRLMQRLKPHSAGRPKNLQHLVLLAPHAGVDRGGECAAAFSFERTESVVDVDTGFDKQLHDGDKSVAQRGSGLTVLVFRSAIACHIERAVAPLRDKRHAEEHERAVSPGSIGTQEHERT